MNFIDKFIENYANGRRKRGGTGMTRQIIIPEITISIEGLKHIKELSEREKTMFPQPIYIEVNTGASLLLWIKEGKLIDYFTNNEVIIPFELGIKNIKPLSERGLEDILKQRNNY